MNKRDSSPPGVDAGQQIQQMHVTTGKVEVDTTEHAIDKELTANNKHKVAVWAYLMTQYNLKPGLRKFGKKGTAVAVTELTQLHVMDTWTVMDPS